MLIFFMGLLTMKMMIKRSEIISQDLQVEAMGTAIANESTQSSMSKSICLGLTKCSVFAACLKRKASMVATPLLAL